jgi:hypothetical protein
MISLVAPPLRPLGLRAFRLGLTLWILEMVTETAHASQVAWTANPSDLHPMLGQIPVESPDHRTEDLNDQTMDSTNMIGLVADMTDQTVRPTRLETNVVMAESMKDELHMTVHQFKSESDRRHDHRLRNASAILANQSPGRDRRLLQTFAQKHRQDPGEIFLQNPPSILHVLLLSRVPQINVHLLPRETMDQKDRHDRLGLVLLGEKMTENHNLNATRKRDCGPSLPLCDTLRPLRPWTQPPLLNVLVVLALLDEILENSEILENHGILENPASLTLLTCSKADLNKILPLGHHPPRLPIGLKIRTSLLARVAEDYHPVQDLGREPLH